MSKIAIIYWSTTGNTEIMANKIFEGAKETENDVSIYACAEFDTATIEDYDTVVLGCPACGSEEMDDTEFIPMFEAIKDKLASKKVAMFGSYGWGGGEYMQTFISDCQSDGITFTSEPILSENTPDADIEEQCITFGKALN